VQQEAVNAFLRWAHTVGQVSELLRVPKLKAKEKVLETLKPEQVQRLIGFRPPGKYQQRIHALTCLLLDTGMRIDEALSPHREEVDFDNLLLRIHGKGRKERVVPMSAEGRKVLWRWLQAQGEAGVVGIVFGTRDGKKLGQRNALRRFKALGARLRITGVRFSFHTLRHTFAVGYIRAGGDVFRLQRILGHSSLEMTRRYVNLQPPTWKPFMNGFRCWRGRASGNGSSLHLYALPGHPASGHHNQGD